jgi:protease I
VGSFASKRIGVVAGEDYHELAFWYPVLRFRELGAAVTVVGSEADKTHRSRLGYPVLPDVGIAAASGTKFDAIVLTEGAAPRSPADAAAVAFLTAASQAGAILAALGAGEKALGCAGLLRGRRVSASPETRPELQSFGAECIAEPVVIDGSMITARSVDDIPGFIRALLAALDAADTKAEPSASRR